MSKSTSHAGEQLAHTLNGIKPGYDGLESLYISLHVKDPGPDGKQNTAELAYPGAARVQVARKSGAAAFWRQTGNKATNLQPVTFPRYTGPRVAIACICLGTAPSGAGRILRRMPLAEGVDLGPNQAPHFEPGDIEFTET